jgi:polyferredoxin
VSRVAWNWLLTFAALVPTWACLVVLGISGWQAFALALAAGFANVFGYMESERGWRR